MDVASTELTDELLAVGYEIARNTTFSKNDIINAYLRAGIAVEEVEYTASLFIDTAVAEGKIKPMNNKPGKFVRKV